jgi:hypothetical protein
VGTLKIRGTFRAKNRQQPHPFFRGAAIVRDVCDGFCGERLQRFARSTSAALLHYRFREIRHPQGRAAKDRWRNSDCEGISSASEISSQYDIRRMVRPNPEYFRRRVSPTDLSSAEFMSGGSGVWPGGKPSETNNRTPPPPPGGGVGVGGTPRRGGRGGTRGVKKTRFRGYYFGANPLCGITRGPPKMG